MASALPLSNLRDDEIRAQARHDRRRHPRNSPAGEPSRDHIVRLILGTYGEMPGMKLSLQQAARLFGLREHTCEIVLQDLVNQGRLRRALDRAFILP